MMLNRESFWSHRKNLPQTWLSFIICCGEIIVDADKNWQTQRSKSINMQIGSGIKATRSFPLLCLWVNEICISLKCT